MKIVAFSINPLYPDMVLGGAPRQLEKVARRLGELGHRVDILCTAPASGAERFMLSPNVAVLPVLRFRHPFPGPYEITTVDLAATVDEICHHLAGADRFYLHDGELLIPDLYEHVPTVVSLRDNVYAETLLGSFLFRGDELIAISEYSRDTFLASAGRYIPGMADRTSVIPNGIDFTEFRPVEPREIRELVPVDPKRDTIVLHPHRPEPRKGLQQTLDVAERLVRDYAVHNLKVLVPEWPNSASGQLESDFRVGAMERIEQRGLTDHVVFHPWVPRSLMPQYFSLGHLTLTLGSFVESFGNASYESMACGTPAIAANVAAHRTVLPAELFERVPYDDCARAAEMAAEIIRNRRGTPSSTLAFMHEHLSATHQVDAYVDRILNARKLPRLKFEPRSGRTAARWALAPWCVFDGTSCYHDFLEQYRDLPELAALAVRGAAFSAFEASAAGIPADALLSLYHEGFVVPAEPPVVEIPFPDERVVR